MVWKHGLLNCASSCTNPLSQLPYILFIVVTCFNSAIPIGLLLNHTKIRIQWAQSPWPCTNPFSELLYILFIVVIHVSTQLSILDSFLIIRKYYELNHLDPAHHIYFNRLWRKKTMARVETLCLKDKIKVKIRINAVFRSYIVFCSMQNHALR